MGRERYFFKQSTRAVIFGTVEPSGMADPAAIVIDTNTGRQRSLKTEQNYLWGAYVPRSDELLISGFWIVPRIEPGRKRHSVTASQPPNPGRDGPPPELAVEKLKRILFVAVMLVIIGVLLYYRHQQRMRNRLPPPKLTIGVLHKFGDIGMDLDNSTGMPIGMTRVHADPDDPEDFAGLRCVDLSPVASVAVRTQAVPQMYQSPRKFPVGTLIYKVGPSTYTKRFVVIAMRKREAGYDPKHNDWSYLYGESYQPYKSGRVEECIACHSKVSADDYVFNLMKP